MVVSGNDRMCIAISRLDLSDPNMVKIGSTFQEFTGNGSFEVRAFLNGEPLRTSSFSTKGMDDCVIKLRATCLDDGTFVEDEIKLTFKSNKGKVPE